MTPVVVLLCCAARVIAQAAPKVVHQDNGIISIITELEPEKIPVQYLQAEPPPARPSRRREEEEEPVVVRSAKIRVVDPETDFRVVHHGVVADNGGVQEVNITQDGGRRVGFDSFEPGYSNYDSYPSVIPNYYPETHYHGRKEGTYGYQNPRENVVRQEQITKIRNNNSPAKVYKHTVVRPVTVHDEARQRTKYGKAGRYDKHASQRRPDRISATPERYNGGRLSSKSRFVRPGKYIPKESSSGPGPGVQEEVLERLNYKNKYPSDGDSNTGSRFVIPQKYISGDSSINRPGVGEVLERTNYGNDYTSGDPNHGKTEKEYSSKTMVRFPDGYSQDNEKRIESSSRYRTGSSYETPSDKSTSNHQHHVVQSNYPEEQYSKNVQLERPASLDASYRKYDGRQVPEIDDSQNSKIESDQPLQGSGSILGSGIIGGIDDGLIEEGGVIFPGRGHGGGFDKENHFEKEKGKEYVAAHKSAHGEKGEKGYNKKEEFSKGDEEKHGHQENKGYAKEKEGGEKSHLDKSSHYASGHKAAEGAKETDFHKEKGHRKGHKKSGFRTVHHKDEFKKNEEFFDEVLDSGNHQEHGHKSKEHSEKAGGQDKKAYLDSGHHHSSRGHESGHDNGNAYNQHKGHHHDKGHAEHYDHDNKYGKKSGYKEGEEHGHSEFGGHKHF